ncbi:SDR family oxidoreductase [Saccharomonospora viridis]|jgi:nucleoside-diphosphate-sugar epimerase|uniref:NAD dependent epimerase/dehydratase family protein n=2 Tax=Saccharomonospora viridis TaxID=1852 RepID=C7MRS7_SACVD|nr:SDR family oxidoreductase [Saccharomonospora viridis]ACU95139.1 NAD dependent epimerase/dehydratase family protein [Saccharomonospora viridis DSM 43017]KHF44770.1 NAD-dependent dehydratase [Saccharomonospora viridis]SFP20944.1 NAD(P)H-binding [Saccharomonospora viridis]
MRVVIAGGHGKIALRLERLLVSNGDTAVGIIRKPEQAEKLREIGAEPVVLDLEQASVDEVADVLSGADAAVFSAGAGPGSGVARKDTVDRAAAVLFAEAAERAGVRRFVQVSAMGAGDPIDADVEARVGEVFAAYLRAKAAAEEDLRGRDLDWTILRPGRLTDEPGTGLVRLADDVPRADVPRDDVAEVLRRLVADTTTYGRTLELVSGDTPIAEAIERL